MCFMALESSLPRMTCMSSASNIWLKMTGSFWGGDDMVVSDARVLGSTLSSTADAETQRRGHVGRPTRHVWAGDHEKGALGGPRAGLFPAVAPGHPTPTCPCALKPFLSPSSSRSGRC